MNNCVGNRLSKPWAAFLFALAALVVAAGCGGSTGPYKTFAMKKGVGHFSFEYPPGYEIGIVEVGGDYTHITLLGPFNKENGSASMLMLIAKVDDSNPAPGVALEDTISQRKRERDFKLLDRSTLLLGGVQAEQAAYSYQQMQRPIGANPPEYVPTMDREIYFAHGDCRWRLSINIPLAVSEASTVDFEHILQSFAILE